MKPSGPGLLFAGFYFFLNHRFNFTSGNQSLQIIRLFLTCFWRPEGLHTGARNTPGSMLRDTAQACVQEVRLRGGLEKNPIRERGTGDGSWPLSH